jgi:MFS family permease
MLLMSGIGSEWAGRLADRSPERLLGRLRVVLAGIIVLGLIQAFVLPPLLYANAQGAPVPVRLLLTFVALAPLGLLMGMPFPMALRLLRPEAAALVPWAWAINGWMSVMASLLTVTLSRMYGYKASFGLALAAYLVALLVAGSLPKIRRSSP